MKLKHPRAPWSALPISPDQPNWAELGPDLGLLVVRLKLGINSARSGGEDGRYASVGGGTTTKPLEKSNLWYGLKTGSGSTAFPLELLTAKGGISSNCSWLARYLNEVQK